MPKRSNPYTEDYVQQSKIHVGLKQFNNNEERLQSVYDKTLELLFNGAKKVISSTNNVSDDKIMNGEIKRDNMKQLLIGKDGSLLKTRRLLDNKPEVLVYCKCGNPSSEPRCRYCEMDLCHTCSHLCSQCNSLYCAQCLLNGWEDIKVCISCYR